MARPPLRLHMYIKPKRPDYWVPEEYVAVSFSISRARFNKLRWAGKQYGLSFRQVINQMIDYAEANMELPNV
jgi:hypothetical protein